MADDRQMRVEELEETPTALQRIADRLAVTIGRPVDIDDERFRLLAHSSHDERVDPVRLASILHRAAPAEVIEHMRRLGIHAAEQPLRVDGVPELGMEARFCVPIRGPESTLGFLWLLDDGTLAAEDEHAAAHAALDAAVVLERARLAHIGLRHRTQTLVLDALGADRERAASALRTLDEEGLLAGGASLRVAVVLADGADGAGEAVASIRRASAEGESACALRDRTLLILLGGAAASEPERVFERLGGEHPGLTVGVGIGTTAADASELRDSLAKAQFAARLALAGTPTPATLRSAAAALPSAAATLRSTPPRRRSTPAVRPAGAEVGVPAHISRWEQLGPFRYLTDIETRVGSLAKIEPAVAALAAEPSGRELLRTLECFLDLGGQVRESASRLNLHRSSLYHRLARIEELLQIDLHDGVQRLDAHLAVKAARVEGLLG